MNFLERVDEYDSPITLTPLKTGGRADVHVRSGPSTTALPATFAETDIVGQLRVFFDRLDAEADARKDDPVAMVNVLARMEALLADVRTVTNTIRQHTADALADNKIRRMTIDDLATVEGTSESVRSDWQDEQLLTRMLDRNGYGDMVDRDTGSLVDTGILAAEILSWFRVQWRLTPIRDAGLNPDDYSTQPTDEDGKPLRTPTVRIHDNLLRRQAVV